MKRLILILSILGTIGCASQQPVQYVVPAPALREVFRGGQLQGLEHNEGQYTGRPGDYDLVEHACVSKPVFGMGGQYLKTIVSCW